MEWRYNLRQPHVDEKHPRKWTVSQVTATIGLVSASVMGAMPKRPIKKSNHASLGVLLVVSYKRVGIHGYSYPNCHITNDTTIIVVITNIIILICV